MGLIHFQKNEWDQALKEFRLALHHLESAVGKTYQALNQTEAAIQAWHKAVELQPALASAHLDLGNAYFEMRDFQRAKMEWKQALAEKGIDIPTHLMNLGMLHFQLKQYGKAIQA